MKINVVKIVGIVGTGLGLAATLISGWAQQRTMEATIAEKVNEAMLNQTEES